MKTRTLLAAVAAVILTACNQNRSEELNALLESKINAEMKSNRVPLSVRDVRTVQKQNNEYRGEVELKDELGNLQTCELDATYDGKEVVYKIYGLTNPTTEEEAPEPDTKVKKEKETKAKVETKTQLQEKAKEQKDVVVEMPKQKPTNAWQGTYAISTTIYESEAYMTLFVDGNNVTGSYTATNYPYDYCATVTGTIKGDKMNLETHEPGSGKVIRWMKGTVRGNTYVCNYRTKSGGSIGTFTWR